MRIRFIGWLLICALGFSWRAPAVAQDREPVQAVALDAGVSLDALVAKLAAKRVVFVGEEHDRYDHHLNQLEIIRRLHALDPNLAIGVEYFQQPFQSQVDAYIAGQISETEFLRRTEYYTRWGYDYRLYAPIFRYAREQQIPVRALNVPSELVSAVARVGTAGLSEKERAQLPKSMEPADPAYRKRLLEAFQQHATPGVAAFERFVQAQLTWDEGMAESAAAYLNASGRRMVILAGAGHVQFGSGIPQRLERRTHVPYAIVLSSGEAIEPGMADYLLLGKEQSLPPAGVLNVGLEEENGECRLASVTAGGAGEKAGLRKGDVVVSVDGQEVQGVADVRLALWDKKPGDMVRLEVRRRHFLRRREQLRLVVELGTSQPPIEMH